jgi:hypothetical protein
MKTTYKLILIATMFTLLSCSKEPGIISGNIFWKYNDYVGNKPDAGSIVSLYSLEENPKDSVYTTTADINGNYKFENIIPGNYFLKVISKNTKSSPKMHLESLKLYPNEIKQIFGLNINIYTLDELKNLNMLNSLNVEDVNDHIKTDRELNSKIADIIQSFPNNAKFKIGLLTGYDNSIYFKKVKIAEGKSSTENIDFGMTYF